MSNSKTLCDWQEGIGRIDKNAKINFSFRNGFSSYCDNLQLFKALGIYNEVEIDVLKGFERAGIKYWGIPNGNEKNGYYNILERPKVTVISGLKIDDNDMGKSIILKNQGKEPIKRSIEVTDSNSLFDETTIEIGSSLEFNESTSIEVASESSKVSTTFSIKHNRQYKEEHSKKTTTEFTISTGEQLVKVKNPTQITKFRVRVVGKFCINCDPRFNGHYLWMPYLD
ncbi:MAG TPA: hypothetical protein VFQ86_02755, partial [Arachidicoccus soli]|nr:hypothetical protein [Arachidicoccus soli]